MSMTRRHLLICATAAGALLAAGHGAWAQGGGLSEQAATNFVVKLGDELVRVINGPGSYEEKKKKLEPVIETAVDIKDIALFCLGRYRRTATPQQLDEYVKLFNQVLLNNVFGKIGEYTGVTFKPTRTTPGDGGMVVGTLIKRQNEQANNAQWVVQNVGGQPKITDLKAEGTSLKITQRSDYESYMQRNGGSVSALITAIRGQLSRS